MSDPTDSETKPNEAKTPAQDPKLPRGQFLKFKAVGIVDGPPERVIPRIHGAVGLGMEGGRMLLMEPISSGVGISRPPAEGKPGTFQTLSAVPTERCSVHYPAALDKYKLIMAVDTTPIDRASGRYVSVGVELRHRLDGILVPWVTSMFDFRGVPDTVNFENLGWKLLTELIMRSRNYTARQRVLILTDKAYGGRDGMIEQEAINNRTQEALAGWMLPPGFELGYASDRSPGDSIMQTAVKMCHQRGVEYRDRDVIQIEKFPVRPAQPNPYYAAAMCFVPPPDADVAWDGRLGGFWMK
jgi:hypothetical protein